MQAKHCVHLLGAAQLELAQTALLFDPAKHLLDAAAGVDRLGVALVACGTAIDGETARAGGVLHHVQRHADPPHLGNKALGVVVLVDAVGLLVGTACVTLQSTIRA